jgi:hypothetical protein
MLRRHTWPPYSSPLQIHMLWGDPLTVDSPIPAHVSFIPIRPGWRGRGFKNSKELRVSQAEEDLREATLLFFIFNSAVFFASMNSLSQSCLTPGSMNTSGY